MLGTTTVQLTWRMNVLQFVFVECELRNFTQEIFIEGAAYSSLWYHLFRTCKKQQESTVYKIPVNVK